MDDAQLRQRLAELHQELESGPELDGATRDLLQKVLADIDQLLKSPDAKAPHEPETIVERLREGSWHIEESHPRLTTAIGQLAEALSRPFQ